MNAFDEKIAILNEFLSITIVITLRNTVNAHEVEIAEMNSVDQLYEKGIDRNGNNIFDRVPYSAFTINKKRELGQPFSHVTLRHTGYFHSTFYVNANNESFEIGSYDSKLTDLVQKYGEEILGLTDYNLNKIVWDYMYPNLIQALKSKL